MGVLSVFALGGWGACSSDSTDPETSSPQNRPAPQAPTGASGAAGEAGSTGATPSPSGPVTEGNPAAEGLGNGGAGSAGTEGAVGAADAGDVVAPPACERALTEANKAVVSTAIDELFVRGDITAVERYWADPYVQHNPIAASGVTAFRNLFSGLVSPGNSIYQLSRVIGECELVLIHGNYTSFGGAAFDMFRVQGGRLVEHWDAFALGAGPNASGHTALDGPTVVQDVALTAQNEALVLEFVQNVLVGEAYDAIDEYMSPDLIEHNPQSSDGSAAYVQNLQDRSLSYRQVRHEIADGNFVFVLSEGAVGTTDVAHYDLFRVENARIVEHWDARRDVPPPPQSGPGIF